MNNYSLNFTQGCPSTNTNKYQHNNNLLNQTIDEHLQRRNQTAEKKIPNYFHNKKLLTQERE